MNKLLVKDFVKPFITTIVILEVGRFLEQRKLNPCIENLKQENRAIKIENQVLKEKCGL